MKQVILSLIAGLAAALSGCAAPSPTDTAPTPLGLSAVSQPAATVTPAPQPTQSAQLSATLTAQLAPTATVGPPGSGTIGIDAVGTLFLGNGPDGRPLYAAYTEGLRNFPTNQTHFVAIYTQSDGGFQEVSRLELPDTDYLGDNSVTRVQIDPKLIWLQVEGGAGANSGCFDLLNFDGRTLTDQAHQCNASPNRSRVEDLYGSGAPEVVLDQSDNLIFCHACGVAKFQFRVLRWDGSSMVEQKLTSLPSPAPADLQQLTNRAVDLAGAGLWKEAQTAIAQARSLNSQDPTVAMDAGLIRLYADAFGEQAQNGPYPLLDNVFYGDYPAALQVMRPLSPAQIFSQQTPLVVGTVAEGFEQSLEQQLITSTTQALQVEPNLAAAHFIRGWAFYLANPGDPRVLSDVQQAAQLDPQEPLYGQSLQYLKSQGSS